MDTINVSLPSQLKSQADNLVAQGYFASFSDLVRTALRRVMKDSEYDLLTEEAVREHKLGRSTVLASAKQIEKYVKQAAS